MNKGSAPVARARPREVFSQADWEKLRRVSSWRGLFLVVHAWGVIALALAASAVFPNPLTWLLAIMVIGARQLGLAILMHEAAHGILHPNKKVNDFVGQWLCAAPVGASLQSYRDYHLSHHRFTQTTADPDLPLSAPFPVSRASLMRKVIRDLTGQTFLKQRLGLLALKLKGAGGGPSGVIQGASYEMAPFIAVNAALLAFLIAIGQGLLFLVWLLAMATWFPLATRLRNIAEHACVASGDDPYTHARTTRANLLERAFIAPYWVNYHAEHHLFMYVPCYRLGEAHRLLCATDKRPRMTVADGYLDVLRRCTLTPAPAA
ncbi:MAG: fatty acid desaturase family protein [Pseudomonadota bacterium]